MEDFERRTRQRYEVGLQRMADTLCKQGVLAHAVADWDFPAHEAIIRRTRRDDIDLIVAECHPTKRKAAPWMLHLTDWELLKASPVPVLLVKNATPWNKPTILAALDPAHAQESRAALDGEILEAASRFCETLKGTLEAMHSYVPIPPEILVGLGASGTMPSEVAAESEKHARKRLDESLEACGKSQLKRHLAACKPTDAIPV